MNKNIKQNKCEMSEYKEIYANTESESESEDEEWNLEAYSSDEEDVVPKKKRRMSEPKNLLRNKMPSKNSKNKKHQASKTHSMKTSKTQSIKPSQNKIAPHEIKRRRRSGPNKTSAIISGQSGQVRTYSSSGPSKSSAMMSRNCIGSVGPTKKNPESVSSRSHRRK